MAPPNLKDLLTAFSPLADFLAIATGDGRVKIWDTVNGQMQSEFANIGSNPVTTEGHLSLDYTCMKWSPSSAKKGKKKGKSSLLALGTGAGDVLGLDTTMGQLRWKVNDCHPGGVRAVSFASNGRVLYSTGVDGMVCELDCETGHLNGKFRASKKAVSSLAISSDGKSLATASAELKVFNSLDRKKVQKFTGHPDSVRAMMFTDDGKYIISSAAGERHVTMWKCDGSNGTGAAACVLSMEHPAVALDCKTFGEDTEGLSVLAVSETGVAYIWRGQSVQELGLAKPSKVTVSSEEVEILATNLRKNSKLCIFAARLQDVTNEDSVMVLVAYGNSVKPLFERLKLEKKDRDIILSASDGGALLPTRYAKTSVKTNREGNEVTALGPDNAEDAILPIPRLETPGGEKRKKKHDKKRRASCDLEEMANGVGVDPMSLDGTEQTQADENAGVVDNEINEPTMEEKLMKLGILDEEKENNQRKSTDPSAPIAPSADSVIVLLTQALRSGDNLLLEKCLSVTSSRVIKKSVISMNPTHAIDLLKDLVYKLKSSPGRAMSILPWIRALLLQHASYIMSEESSLIVLNTLYQMIDSRISVFRPILQLSGRLDLILSQISPNEEENAPVVDSVVVYEEGSDEDEELVEAVADSSGEESDDNDKEDVVMDDGLNGNKTMHEGSESE